MLFRYWNTANWYYIKLLNLLGNSKPHITLCLPMKMVFRCWDTAIWYQITLLNLLGNSHLHVTLYVPVNMVCGGWRTAHLHPDCNVPPARLMSGTWLGGQWRSRLHLTAGSCSALLCLHRELEEKVKSKAVVDPTSDKLVVLTTSICPQNVRDKTLLLLFGLRVFINKIEVTVHSRFL